jgi:hypothetical protein
MRQARGKEKTPAAVGSVGSALVEATVDVRSVANAKDIEAAKKSA